MNFTSLGAESRNPQGSQRNRQLEHQVEKINEAVQQLLTHAEEGAEQRKLLWKIDMSLRQLRNLPQPASPPPASRGTTPQRNVGGRRESTKSTVGSGQDGNNRRLSASKLPAVPSNPDVNAGD